MNVFIKKLINTSLLFAGVIALISLAFRSTLYWAFTVADGEPYGGGDAIEMLFFSLILLSCAVVIILSFIRLGFWFRLSKAHCAKSILASISIGVLYFNLHGLMPRLM